MPVRLLVLDFLPVARTTDEPRTRTTGGGRLAHALFGPRPATLPQPPVSTASISGRVLPRNPSAWPGSSRSLPPDRTSRPSRFPQGAVGTDLRAGSGRPRQTRG